MSWVVAAIAAAGAIAGSQKDKSKQSSSSSVQLGPATALENQGVKLSGDQLKELESLIKAGPGQSDITAANDSSKNLTDLLARLQGTGGIASGAELAQAREQSAALFAPEQVALNQNFEQQRIENSRIAARLGRQVNDPILAAKLAQEQTRQQQMLDARHTAFAAQAPQRQLDMAGQLFNIRQGLASQALANRQALFALGQQAMSNERQFRLATATRTNTSNQESGGGLKGAIMGGIAGYGAAMGAPGIGGGGQQKAGASGGMGQNSYQYQPVQTPVQASGMPWYEMYADQIKASVNKSYKMEPVGYRPWKE